MTRIVRINRDRLWDSLLELKEIGAYDDEATVPDDAVGERGPEAPGVEPGGGRLPAPLRRPRSGGTRALRFFAWGSFACSFSRRGLGGSAGCPEPGDRRIAAEHQQHVENIARELIAIKGDARCVARRQAGQGSGI